MVQPLHYGPFILDARMCPYIIIIQGASFFYTCFVKALHLAFAAGSVIGLLNVASSCSFAEKKNRLALVEWLLVTSRVWTDKCKISIMTTL